MDQLERLKDGIDASRADLRDNLRDLERKVEDVADWRYQFRQRPFVVLGAAVAVGAVVGALVGPDRSAPLRRTMANEAKPGVAHDLVPQAWANLKAALIGVAAARLQDAIDELLPGFKHHYHAAEQRTTGFVRAM
jgi:hypothetical protein